MISLNLHSVSVRRVDELVMSLANGRNLTKTDLSKREFIGSYTVIEVSRDNYQDILFIRDR